MSKNYVKGTHTHAVFRPEFGLGPLPRPIVLCTMARVWIRGWHNERSRHPHIHQVGDGLTSGLDYHDGACILSLPMADAEFLDEVTALGMFIDDELRQTGWSVTSD